MPTKQAIGVMGGLLRFATDADRFWSKVAKNGGDGCWTWRGTTNNRGYGLFSVGGRGGRMMTAHRYVLLLSDRAVPDGLTIDHLCRNRRCVNPDHLELTTAKENQRRGLKGVLTTHCPQGHPYDEANTAIHINGGRRCRACNAARLRQYRAKEQDRLEAVRGH